MFVVFDQDHDEGDENQGEGDLDQAFARHQVIDRMAGISHDQRRNRAAQMDEVEKGKGEGASPEFGGFDSTEFVVELSHGAYYIQNGKGNYVSVKEKLPCFGEHFFFWRRQRDLNSRWPCDH